ncbi:LysR family transcriptional regulator [Enterobacteriaceae bacterium C23F]
MDRLEAMSLLIKVVDSGSMSAVSREIGIPLPTVSRKIAELEKHLGIQILTRSTRKLALTDAGADYLIAARRILEEIDSVERAAAGEYQVPKGELVITAPTMFGRLHILPLVTHFLADWPDIKVRLRLSNHNADLIEEHVDLALRIGHLPDSSLVAIPLGTMRTVVCAHPCLLERYGIPENPSSLNALPLIQLETRVPADGIWDDLFRGQRHAFMNSRLMVTTPEAALDAAVSGAGFARLLHYQVIDAVRAGQLKIVLEQFELPAAPVHLIYPNRGPNPLKVRKFIEYAVPLLRKTLTSESSRKIPPP